MRKRLHSMIAWLKRHKKMIFKIGGVALLLLLVIQLFYPSDRLLPFSRVEGVAVGGQTKQDAAASLDKRSSVQRMPIALGKLDTDFDKPVFSDVGLKVAHKAQLGAIDYPWYLRVIPTSLLWLGLFQGEDSPVYTFDQAKLQTYLVKKLGDECLIAATSATVKQSGDTLTLVSSKAGADCDRTIASKTITAAKPRINKVNTVTIPATVIAPAIGDDEAKKLSEKLNRTTDGGVPLKVANKIQKVEQKEVLSWLVFSVKAESLGFDINPDKANAYLAKAVTPTIAKPAGVTKVSTSDFTEISRQDGPAGQTLDLGGTLADVTRVLNDEKDQAQAQVTSLAPKIEYTRTYSKTSTGIAAQLKFYDDDNAGVFGVSFVELGGQGLNAQHNGDRQFVTASTYKLFVAFSTIKRVEAGQMKWDDGNIAGGRDLAKCFDDMIVKSDNACAEALIKKIGAKDLNADIKSLGLTATAFKSDDNVTTANDLVKYLTQLEKGTMPIKPENRERLLGAMKRNVYRQGVPSGASGQVADKVGFLAGLLHDAGVVYSPKGTYVLVVMTDGSSWSNIADLTRKIEALR